MMYCKNIPKVFCILHYSISSMDVFLSNSLSPSPCACAYPPPLVYHLSGKYYLISFLMKYMVVHEKPVCKLKLFCFY